MIDIETIQKKYIPVSIATTQVSILEFGEQKYSERQAKIYTIPDTMKIRAEVFRMKQAERNRRKEHT
jgi:hypothetical protein